MSWHYHNPTKIYFGVGQIEVLAKLHLPQPLIVTTPGAARRGHVDRLYTLLKKSAPGTDVTIFDQAMPNPEIQDVENAIAKFRNANIQNIVAIGGGSSIDFGKAMAHGLAQKTSTFRESLLQNVVTQSPLPLTAIPTTAGTGSEMTPFATIWDMSIHKKYSLSAPQLFPKNAILDPELTQSLTWEQTVAPGLDAFSQCFESLWNKARNPITIAQATTGIRQIPMALRALKNDPKNLTARSAMLEGAMLSGLAISQTRTAQAHAISYPLTARWGVPHGIACSFTLPAIWRLNAQADPEWASDISKKLGFISTNQVEHSIIDLLNYADIKSSLLSYIKDYDILAGVAAEMITPGRSDNMLFSVNKDSIVEILALSKQLLNI